MLNLVEKHVADKRAWDRFIEVGLPTKTWETFRYVRLSDLYSREFALGKRSDIAFTPKEGQLVFVNGRYVEELSLPPEGVVALPLSKAKKTYGSFLNHRFASQLKIEKDPFALLNGALSEEGLFVYLPPKSISQFEVLHFITEHVHPIITTPRVVLFGAKGAQARCYMIHHADQWINSLIDITLDEHASLRLVSILDGSETSWQFDAVRATLKQGSSLTSYAIANGGATSRQDYVVQLLEERAEAALYGVCQVHGKRHHHINVLMEHHAPHCRSLQHFKNVLKGTTRTSFEGKIYVHQAAQKTEAYQMNHNLVLSKHASANSKPNLEIFADDVKASHGSTVGGQLDDEHLFYLKTRGIPQEEAKQLLVEGFCREILDQIEMPYAHMCRFS